MGVGFPPHPCPPLRTFPFVRLVFEQPVGDSDGSRDGKAYFSCMPLHGCFVRPNDCRMYGSEGEEGIARQTSHSVADLRTQDMQKEERDYQRQRAASAAEGGGAQADDSNMAPCYNMGWAAGRTPISSSVKKNTKIKVIIIGEVSPPA